MLRRLYYLLPDQAHARSTVQELYDMGIPQRAVRAMTREGIKLEGLPEASLAERRDPIARIENLFWYGDLWLFFIAALGLLLAIAYGSVVWMALTIATMLITFAAGANFTIRLPKTHLDKFTEAMSHGEILLMVDVPFNRLVQVEKALQHHHPEATPGGSCWHLDVLGH